MSDVETGIYSRLLRGDVNGGVELQQAQSMLGMLMDSLASAVFWKDTESRYLGCNRTFADFGGLPASQLIGRTDRDMPWASYTSDYLDWDQRVMDSGEPALNIVEPFLGADGLERWISTNKVPIRDFDGSVVGVLGSFRDITAQRKAELDLQHSVRVLDERVEQRTSELAKANAGLRREVEKRTRLEANERRLRKYSEARRRIHSEISNARNEDEVLTAMVSGIHELVSADLVAVVSLDQGPLGLTRISTSNGYEPVAVTSVDLGRHDALSHLGQPRCPSLDGEPLFVAFGPAESTIAFELSSGGESLFHVVLESRQAGFYTQDHADGLGEVLDQAATVITNLRLRAAERERIASEERDQLARNLHDSVVQTLAATSLTVDAELAQIDSDNPALPTFQRLERLTTNAYLEIRALLSQMRFSDAAPSLSELLAELAQDFEFGEPIPVETSLQTMVVDHRTTLEIVRMVQEALNNIDRHANATLVQIHLLQTEDGAVISVHDDGVGFNPALVAKTSMGLQIMAERAAAIGAELNVITSPGSGSTITISFAAENNYTTG